MPKNAPTYRTWLMLLGCFVLLFSVHMWQHMPDGATHISFLDVGQGDSIFIVTPTGKQILIDGGPDLSALEQIGKRMSYFDRSLNLLILTHPHLDHLAGFPSIFQRYDVDTFLFVGINASNARYRALLRDLTDGHPKARIAMAGSHIDLGNGISMEILWPPESWYGKGATNENNASVVIKLFYKEHSALFVGDIERPVEQALLASQRDLQAEILKIGHHGSDTSSSEAFLRAVDPDLSIISVGKENRFGHPKKTVLDRLEHLEIPYKRTDQDGTIEIVWD